MVQTEFALDLVHEVGGLVTDPARAVTAEIAQVLAHLGRIDAGQFGQLLGGDVQGARLDQLVEYPQVDRQTGDGGFRDAASGAVAHRPLTLDRIRKFTKSGERSLRGLLSPLVHGTRVA